ncbi:hypothetical protein Tco_0650697 [Tanacetum coccineum]
MEAFMEWFKAESMHVKGAPECMRVSGFMYGITNRYLIKRQNDNIPKSVDEMMSVTIAFLRGEVAMAHQSRKKGPPIWRHHEGSHKPSFDKRQDFKNRQKSSRRHDRFTLPTKTPKEILAVDTIEEAFKSGQLSHLILIKILEERETTKGTSQKLPRDKKDIRLTRRMPLQALPWLQPVGSSNDGQESPMVVEAEVGGHLIHRMYVDGGSASEVLYENCFGLREIIQVVPSTVHEMLKFPVWEGIVTLHNNTIVPTECRMLAEAPSELPPNKPTAEKGVKVAIHPEYLEQTVTIGGSLSEKGKIELCDLLKGNLDIFA